MIEGTIYTALSGLVNGRCFPSHFPQDPDLPVWPAIRYLTFNDAVEDLCGTVGADVDDVRVQIDVVAKTHGGMLTLRDQVITALRSVQCARQSGGFQTFDEETKTHRSVLFYLFQQSTEANSPM